MTHVEPLAYGNTALRRSPGFLLTPFGWAAEPLAVIVNAEPQLLGDLFELARPRMHLIALALAHLELPVPPEIGPLLTRCSARQVLDRVLGYCPAGIKRVLNRLPAEVLELA